MKSRITTIGIILLFIACSKENGNQYQAAIHDNIVIHPNSKAGIPINDLGAGKFSGYTGGLYPGGVNTPSGAYANDLLATSQSIIPIDSFGNPAATLTGKIVFISLGSSTGGHNMKQLKIQTVGNPLVNPKLLLLNCNNGYGMGSLNSIMDTNDVYWNHVTLTIKKAKLSFRQVQVIYLETDDSSTSVTWPARAILVKNDLEICMRILKKKFPNVKVLYVLGRTRSWSKSASYNREPAPYYFGWGCKWAIEDQINGVPGTGYKDSHAVAPMIAWGFYQYADTMPRKTDGFKWLRKQTTTDGLHASSNGQDTLATRFQNFLLADKYASIWYAAP